jgi:hypothetical protein
VWGRNGRGHPNRYSMIAKPQQAAVSSSGKPQRAAVLASRTKPQPSELKPQPDDHKTAAGCHEPLRNHLKNHKRAASPPTPPVLLESVTDHRERAYAALWEVYPNKTYPHDGPEAFGQLLDEGIDADDLIAEAKRYATKCSGMNGKNIPFLCFWLRVEAKPALEASRLLNMGRAGKLARTTGDDNGIAPKAHAGKIYDSHYEAAYGPEP